MSAKNAKYWIIGAILSVGILVLPLLSSLFLPSVWAYENGDYVIWASFSDKHSFERWYSKGCERMWEYEREHDPDNAFLTCDVIDYHIERIVSRATADEITTLTTQAYFPGEKGPDYFDAVRLQESNDTLTVTQNNNSPRVYTKVSAFQELTFWKSVFPRYLLLRIQASASSDAVSF